MYNTSGALSEQCGPKADHMFVFFNGYESTEKGCRVATLIFLMIRFFILNKMKNAYFNILDFKIKKLKI